LSSFYQEARAPNLIKSIIFNLLSRLITKLRFVYRKSPQEGKLDYQAKKQMLLKHFERIFIDKEFISTLLTELQVHKEQEEHALQFQPKNHQAQILYTAFV
jgi:hypothetical protein